MSNPPSVLQVVIMRDGLLVGTEVFVPGQFSVGSDPASDLRLEDLAVSPTHAYLYFQNGKAAVQDNGTGALYVNGHRINACEVRAVDEVHVGPFSLKIRLMAQKATKKPSPSAEMAALLGAKSDAPTTLNRGAGPEGFTANPTAPERPRAASAGTAPAPAASTVVSPRRPAAPPPPPPISAPELEERTQSVVVDARVDLATLENEVAPLPKPVKKPAPAPHVASSMSARPARHAPGRPRRASAGPTIPAATEGKGRPKLFLELYWNDTRQKALAFGHLSEKKPVFGSDGEGKAPRLSWGTHTLPLWGFDLPEVPFVLAESQGKAYRVYLPPSGDAVLRKTSDAPFEPLALDNSLTQGKRRVVILESGGALKLRGRDGMTFVAYVQPPLPRPFANPLRNAPWLMLFLLFVIAGGFGAFTAFMPKEEAPDFSGKKMLPVSIRLITPDKKAAEEQKKKVEAVKKEKEVEAKKPEKKVVEDKPRPKPTPKPAAPEQAALKAVAKLTAAGPMKDLLAAVDKLGGGPGDKKAKQDYKLSGLIGKAPIANAGLGTFGIGGGGQGGQGFKGLEVLRGKGGGGIGALGAGAVGKGRVGGTVGTAVSRAVGAQGSIDKDRVAKVINEHLQEVRACYEKELLKTPSLGGKVSLEWSIDTSGKVTTARTKSSTMNNAGVESCILGRIKTWVFPPARGGHVIITYPFQFNSVGY